MSAILRCQAYRNAGELPPEFWSTLMKNEAAANTILPFAKKALDSPLKAESDHLWIILYNDTDNDVEFVLSCTQGALGNYPIFVFTPKSSAELIRDEDDGKNLADSLSVLILCLLKEVPPQRVFSVFSVAYVAEKFAKVFKEHAYQEHGIQPIEDPYYDATFTFCTGETLNKSVAFPLPEFDNISIHLCPADMSHLKGIKALCKGFSYTSPPYILDDERAEEEAKALINNQQAWVHMIQKGDEDSDIACLVAATRQSKNVTAVTKVFTTEHWRGRGCAGRLLYRVCTEILRKKERVVLYVGNGVDLTAARKLYHKIGFQGLNENQHENVENVERYLEIGFQSTELGYW